MGGLAMEHFDQLESRDPAEREQALFAELRLHVARAKARSPYWRRILQDVDPDSLIDRAGLAMLPVLAKSDLIDLQAAEPPLGGLATEPAGAMKRLFFSPGPIAESQPRGEGDHWRMARALFAAGIREGDVVVNCFSYHLTPAGFMFDGACAALGCAVLPGGVGQSETQVQAINRLGVAGYVGTPDFLQTLMEKAEAMGTPITTITKALVTGGPLFPKTRAWYEERGVRVRQCYGTAELGLLAYETDDPTDGMVVDENVVLEIVRPGGGDLAGPGEVGEIVATVFGGSYPLIRLGTGDLSALAEGGKRLRPQQHAHQRLGWAGPIRPPKSAACSFTPRQVQAVLKAFPAIHRARLEVSDMRGATACGFFVKSRMAARRTKLRSRTLSGLSVEFAGRLCLSHRRVCQMMAR